MLARLFMDEKHNLEVVKLRGRLRRGVPDALRGNVWALLGDVPNQIDNEKKGEYARLVRKARSVGRGEPPSERRLRVDGSGEDEDDGDHDNDPLEDRENNTGENFKDTIERDIDRTFPTHRLFEGGRNGADRRRRRRTRRRDDVVSRQERVTTTTTANGCGDDDPLFACGDEASRDLCDGDDDDVEPPPSPPPLLPSGLVVAAAARRRSASSFSCASEPDLIADRGGRASLRRVLRAYSVYDPEVGYCQGMNFLSAMFITFMREEEAFWLLVWVMNGPNCDMRGLFCNDMTRAREVLHVAERLIDRFLPDLSAHFREECVDVTMYGTQWLLTVYSSTFPFATVTRIWDCFLLEGWKIAYRVMLALLGREKDVLMKMNFEQIMIYLKEIPERVDADALLERAFAIPLKRTHIAKYEKEWQEKEKKLTKGF